MLHFNSTWMRGFNDRGIHTLSSLGFGSNWETRDSTGGYQQELIHHE